MTLGEGVSEWAGVASDETKVQQGGAVNTAVSAETSLSQQQLVVILWLMEQKRDPPSTADMGKTIIITNTATKTRFSVFLAMVMTV